MQFTADFSPMRVRFGSDMDAAIAEEADRLSATRLTILVTPSRQDDARVLADVLAHRVAGVFAGAEMHTPAEATERAVTAVKGLGADGLIALGGGSTIGLGKAIRLRTGLPFIAVPTTYAGSEATSILGQTENSRKTTIRDPSVLPSAIVYDVSRTLSLPATITVTSGLNAIAHAVEALYAPDAKARFWKALSQSEETNALH